MHDWVPQQTASGELALENLFDLVDGLPDRPHVTACVMRDVDVEFIFEFYRRPSGRPIADGKNQRWFSFAGFQPTELQRWRGLPWARPCFV